MEDKIYKFIKLVKAPTPKNIKEYITEKANEYFKKMYIKKFSKKFSAIIIAIIIVVTLNCCNKKENKIYIIDSAYFLPDTLEDSLNRCLNNISRKGSVYIYVRTVMAENYYSRQFPDSVFNTINLNDKSVVFLFISHQDKKIRIITNKIAKEKLSDVACSRIIKGISQYFMDAEYPAGIKFGINQIDSITSNSRK